MKRTSLLPHLRTAPEIVPQEQIMIDIRERCRLAIQVTLQTVLDEELAELVGADRYERTEDRVDARNGSYRRTVVTGREWTVAEFLGRRPRSACGDQITAAASGAGAARPGDVADAWARA